MDLNNNSDDEFFGNQQEEFLPSDETVLGKAQQLVNPHQACDGEHDSLAYRELRAQAENFR